MEKKNNWKAWLYLAPVLILMAVFTFYPLINTTFYAFVKDYNSNTSSPFGLVALIQQGFTLENFGTVLGLVSKKVGTSTIYYTDVIKYAIPNTLLIVFVTVPLSIIIALLIAVALNSIKVLGKIFQTIFFIPYVTNAIAVGMVFAVIFDQNSGLINSVFNLGNKAWISGGANRGDALFALFVYIVWHALPYKILIFLSGLQSIDKQYYQAAKIDAATKAKTFMNVTVPLLSPQIVYVMITSFIGSFKEYTSIVGLFNGKTTGDGTNNMYTVVYYIYDQISGRKAGLGSAAAVLLFIVILIFTAIQKVVSDKKVHY